MPAFTAIFLEQIDCLIGPPDAPAGLDVRTATEFACDPHLLPTTRRTACDGQDEGHDWPAGHRA